MTQRLLLLLALCALAQPAHGDACSDIGDQTARRACTGAAAKAGADISGSRPSSIPSTTEVVGDLSTTRPRVADDRLMALPPAELVGRPLLIRKAHCRYEDVNKYACVTHGDHPIEVRALVVLPVPSQVAVESRCGRAARSSQRECVGTVKVVPTAASLDRRGASVWLVLSASEIQVEGNLTGQ